MEVGHKDFTRKKPDQLVYLELGAGNGGMLLSISEDGFRFRAVSPVRSNGTMPFAFSLDGRHRLEGNGTVEWLEEDGKSGGMRFTEVSEEFQATLKGWLASDSSHPSGGREVTPAAAAPFDTCASRPTGYTPGTDPHLYVTARRTRAGPLRSTLPVDGSTVTISG